MEGFSLFALGIEFELMGEKVFEQPLISKVEWRAK